MLETLISSRTRIKLLLRLFLNPGTTAYLRGLADEFDESTNSIRVELNRFEDAGMIVSESRGNKKMYKANDRHPLFGDLRSILMKYIGIDRVIEVVIDRMGKVDRLYLTGDYAKGKDSGIIDLVLVGDIDKEYLVKMVSKAEKLIDRKVRFLTYDSTEWNNYQHSMNGAGKEKYLLLWENK
ncbi:MAG: winged helix-turn-helix transcriptional regulator [Flavipsychrobacter sp.]|nr:winged helix-turn-helix transcriptional regulator [Flavipsychrobacter sp.]